MIVEVTGPAVPRLTRREITSFARQILLHLEKNGRVTEAYSDLSIAFVGDEAMKSLNRQFRRKNRTTDVLTFPTGGDTINGTRPLGEIVICLDQARRQAAQEHHSLATEVRYLILHGILHALGYDHEADQGEMNALEIEVRSQVGLE